MMTPLFLAVFVCLTLGSESFATSESSEKRVGQSCTYDGTSTSTSVIWPKTCGSAPEGAFCLPTGTCGCKKSADCWVNSKSPFCLLDNTGNGGCVPCSTATGGASTVENTDHYWCREVRYPSTYIVSSIEGPLVNQQSEYVAGTDDFSQFYREVCFTDGSCARCDQANAPTSGVTAVTFPSFATFTLQSSKDAAWGTVFCNYIRGAKSAKPGRPICASTQGFTDVGLGAKIKGDFLTTAMDVAQYADQGPVTNGLTGKIIGSSNANAGAAQAGVVITQPLNNWEGACVPCRLADSSAGGDPTKIPTTSTTFHSLCSRALPTLPICDAADNVGCRACRTNAECGVATAACATDGTASCTGGLNCQADGSCKTCTSDADCGVLDGGETAGQGRCSNGICTSPFKCAGNFGAGTAADCPTAALPNCNVDGSCIFCGANGQCGVTDLGGQQVCNRQNGVCGLCTLNDDCVGTSGANCMKDGSCRDCTAALCTIALDGGLPTGGVPAKCGNGFFCADDDEQVICNSATRLCEDPCLSNLWCASRSQFFTVGGGANCMLDGYCRDCGNQQTNSPSCVNLDGPLLTRVGADGTPNQPDCGPNNICISPFQCTTNPSCAGQPGANCQTDGSCVSCVVTYTSSTCSGFDGGEIKSQINCNQNSRLCVGACGVNADCIGTQGSNCMSNGLCLTCRTDSDCISSGNNWGGDGGEIKGQSICGSNGICISACTGNFGTLTTNPCTATAPNCHANGLCVNCVSDADCAAADGPPGANKNTVCNQATKICVDPFTCGTTPATSVDNAGCRANYPGGANNNCMNDGTCMTCTSNAQCFSSDGGNIPKQPRCDSTSGTCVSCQSNDDCPSSAANCNKDGLCYDCRQFGTQTCANLDGPPGTPVPNFNCDSVTGICVDFCTQDSHCLDSCFPRCQKERGCCVECLTSSDCPVAQWRGTEKDTKTFCDTDFGYMCTSQPGGQTANDTVVCVLDEDCNFPGSSGPACSPSQNQCVECLYDSHCGDPTPACNTAQQKCVGCTIDDHCPSGFFCGSSYVCQTQVIYHTAGDESGTLVADDGVSVAAGVLPFLAVFFALFH